MGRRKASAGRENGSKPAGALSRPATLIELAATEGAIIFKEDGSTETYFPEAAAEATHVQKMALLMFVYNDDELLKLAELRHAKFNEVQN